MTTEFEYLPDKEQKVLSNIAAKILQKGKGILCIDESTSILGQRLAKIGMQNNAENRRQFRQLLLTANWERRLNENISGVLVNHESLHQCCDSGLSFIDLLKKQSILIGIKVDMGSVNLTGSRNENTAQGLDNLRNRCVAYKKAGCTFAKWRCTYKIGLHEPSYQCIIANATTLARFASICQSTGLLPIIQAEVLLDGDHVLEECEMASEAVLAAVVKSLNDHHVCLEGCLLEVNMITGGVDCDEKYTYYDVAFATLRVLRRTIPPAVPGILFPGGGQLTAAVLLNLNAINRVRGRNPWALTFIFGRLLQVPIVSLWDGKKENIINTHIDLLNRTWLAGQASTGRYFEKALSSLYAPRTTMFVPNYNY